MKAVVMMQWMLQEMLTAAEIQYPAFITCGIFASCVSTCSNPFVILPNTSTA
jgi:hypothetical protein